MRNLFAVLAVSVFIVCNTQAQDSVSNKTAKPVTKPVVTKPLPLKTVGVKPAQTNPANTRPAQVQPSQATATPPTYVAPAPQNTDKSLNGQYQYILSKTYHYQQPMIAAFWKNVRDTMAIDRKKLKDVNDKLTIQAKTTAALQNDLNEKTANLTDATTKKDEISFLGISMPKGTYNMLMWGAVAVLAVALLIVVLRTGGSRREAKYRTKLYDELSEEFQAYKVKANEKEKKLARELQTERNKVDELLGRG